MKKILANKLYMKSLLADLISNFGDILYYIAMLNYVLLLEKSELALSIITISETIPIFSGLFTGVMADKIKEKVKVVNLTLIFRMVLYIFLGLIVKFEPALWIVIIAAIINFFSDMSAQLENGLFIPIRMRLTNPEDRQEYIAFSQTATMACVVLFQMIAGILAGIMSFSNLAFFNAGTFALSLAIILSMRKQFNKLFEERPLLVSQEKDVNSSFLKSMYENLKDAVNEFRKIGDMKLSLIIAPIVNAIGVAIPILVTLIIKNNEAFIIKDAPFTLAITQSSMFVGTVFGGLLVMSIFKEFDLNTTLIAATAGICLISFSMYIQNIYLFIFFMFATGLLSGALNPKLNAMIMNKIPEDKLATVGGGLGTYFQLGMLLMRLLLSGLILIMSVKKISLFILITSILITIYGIYEIIRSKNASNNQ